MILQKEESPPPIESKDPIRLGKVIRKKKAPAKPVASTKDGQEGIQEDATAAEVVKKKKKNRRGPSGYALIGEGVEDSAADRRARLKAARSAGKTFLGKASMNTLKYAQEGFLPQQLRCNFKGFLLFLHRNALMRPIPSTFLLPRSFPRAGVKARLDL